MSEIIANGERSVRRFPVFNSHFGLARGARKLMAYSLFRGNICFLSSRDLLISAAIAGLLFCPAALIGAAEAGSTVNAAIKVDQVGYPRDGPKVALVSAPAESFTVRRSSDDRAVLRGKLIASAPDALSGDTVEAADFSSLRKPGKYYIEVPGVGRSWDFAIEKNVYRRAYYLAMRGFYGQRCGTAVDMGPEFPEYKHAACHQKGEFHPSSGASGPRNNIGGWHDAGDYGRYMVNSGVTTGTLLWTWEIYRKKAQSYLLSIPESGNGTPDILNETRWNLEWMLKMQDDDGGVWHKQTSEHFSGFVAPEDDDLPSEVIGTGKAPFKSTCATADLAAVGAIAARVYKPFDASVCRAGAGCGAQGVALGGEEPQCHLRESARRQHRRIRRQQLRRRAAVGRSRALADHRRKALQRFFRPGVCESICPTSTRPLQRAGILWAPMGLWTYALGKRKGSDREAINAIRARTVAAAHTVVDRTNANPYRMSMQAEDYVWGSNGVAAGYGMYLLIANTFQPGRNFRDAARDNLHYLLGRNTFSLSWVTQLGEHSVEHPHHRPSGSGKQPGPWPGLLAGGPNRGRQDAVLAALPKDLPPAKVYADQLASYASNEIAINWQASLVFLLAGELK